jgi:hypothetical protein
LLLFSPEKRREIIITGKIQADSCFLVHLSALVS